MNASLTGPVSSSVSVCRTDNSQPSLNTTSTSRLCSIVTLELIGVQGDVVVVAEPFELRALVRVEEVLGRQVVDVQLVREVLDVVLGSGC